MINGWNENGGNRLLHVSNGVEQRVSGVDGVYAVIPMSRDTAYVNQYICTATGGDGVSAAKWSLDSVHSKVDFSTGELSVLSAPVVMSIVN